jgi:hypothetical protein
MLFFISTGVKYKKKRALGSCLEKKQKERKGANQNRKKSFLGTVFSFLSGAIAKRETKNKKEKRDLANEQIHVLVPS